MTQSPKALVLGGGRIRVSGRMVGQIKGAYVERRVSKATHDSNFGLEYKTDFAIAVKTAFNIGWVFEEIQPANINMLLGMPGFGAVPTDRSLPGTRRTPALLAYGSTRRQYVEHPRLLLDSSGKGVWAPLLYPLALQDSSAAIAPEITVDNVDLTGTIGGYTAVCITALKVGETNESLPSNIEFVPYTTTADDLRLSFFKTTSMDMFSIYFATCTRNSTTGEFTFTGPFQQLTEFHNTRLSYFTPNADGSYTITNNEDSTAVPLRPVATVAAIEPPIPLTVTYPLAGVGTPTAASFPEDFLYEVTKDGGGALRISGSAVLTSGVPVTVTYWHDISRIRELPLIGSGTNPVVECDMEILFPDQESKMIWHFYKLQVNSDMRIATAETDWMGVDFAGETMDASELYPRYGFGYLQLAGPIADEVAEFGNQPYDGLVNALASNQTSYS